MITVDQLNPHHYTEDDVIKGNLLDLCRRINIIEDKYGKPLLVTSGLRSELQQENLIKMKLSNATHSRHLTGQAVDILDAQADLYNFCKDNESVLEEAGLWCEERQGGWQHFQSQPPKSGKRWFIP